MGHEDASCVQAPFTQQAKRFGTALRNLGIVPTFFGHGTVNLLCVNRQLAEVELDTPAVFLGCRSNFCECEKGVVMNEVIFKRWRLRSQWKWSLFSLQGSARCVYKGGHTTKNKNASNNISGI